MATYVRQSSFSDGDTITAALFNNEFNQLVNAFDVATGHTHDGSTAGDGGPISNLFSNALVFGTNTDNDVVITFNANSNDGVLTWMEDEDYFQFSDDLLLTTTEKVQFRDTAIYINSSTDGQLDIVADTEVQIAATTIDMNGNADISGNLEVGGNLTVTGTTTFNGGTITMGDAATDNVVFGADVDSNIIPDDDDSYDLGSSTQEWRNLYIDGTANIDSLVADTADINGGTIDAANITVGSGKTLDVSAGTLTLADNQISGDKVEGGTINATTINTLTYGSITDGTITVTAFVDEDDMSSNSATLIPTQQSVKAYVDAQDTAQDLDLVSDSGTIAIDLDGETLTVTGGEGIDTSASSNTLTITGEDATTSNKGIASFNSDDFNVSSGAVTLATTSTAAELNLLDGTTAGTIVASKGVAVDANKDITGFRNITLTGELDAGSLDVSGNVDVDGTLETDALSINGTVVTSTAAELNILDGKAFLDEDDMSSNSATGIASQQSIKAYVDSQVTAQDLDFQGDTGGALSIDLDSESLTIAGGTGLDTVGSGNTVTINIDSTVATLTGSQTLTNKSLTAPTLTGTATVASLDISGDIDVDGTTNLDVVDIDGAVAMATSLTIGGTSPRSNYVLDVRSSGGNGLNIQAGDESADVVLAVGSTSTADKFTITSGGAVTTTGVVTANAGVVVDTMTLDGSTLTSTGDFIVDAAADIIFDADANDVLFKDGGTEYFRITNNGTSFVRLDAVGDIILDADGGDIYLDDGGTGFGQISGASSNLTIKSSTADKDIIFQGNDGGSTITALTLDMSAAGAATFNSGATFGGDVTQTTGDYIYSGGGNFDIKHSTASQNIVFSTTPSGGSTAEVLRITSNGDLAKVTGDLTLDVAGDIIFNADGGDWKFQDGAAGILEIQNDGSGNAVLITTTADKDMRFLGNDSGSTITALTLDMSDGGTATFNSHIRLGDNKTASFGAGYDIEITSDGTNGTISAPNGNLTLDVAGVIVLDADNAGVIQLKDAGVHYGSFFTSSDALNIQSNISDGDIIFKGNDGGSGITALTLDMSNAGAATFNSTVTTGGAITSNAGSIVIGTTSLSQPILQFLSSTSGANTIHFGDGASADAYKGYINYNHANEKLDIVGSGDITLDAAGDIILDADGGDLEFKDGSAGTLHSWKQGVYRIHEQAAGTQYNNSLHNHTNNYQYILGGSNGLILADNTDQSNRIIVDNGLQIAFDINGVSTAKFTQYGGLAFGSNNSAATTLDDYEEGTWTPVVHGSTDGAYTYSGVTSRYTKIGNLVTLTCQLTNITTSGSGHAGYLQIRNAPFNKIADTFPVGSVELSSVDMSSGTTFATAQFITTSSTNTLYIRQHGDNSGGGDLPVTAINSGTSDITISIQYIA